MSGRYIMFIFGKFVGSNLRELFNSKSAFMVPDDLYHCGQR
ncbi:5019_t:CDS:2 [Acaulospora morrowiae]|uniref:5019_t:CDS:1 n=1 Tax=Acaulospora morrowiae TaxID=94023 RepID=A0A9N8ZJ44_9GLOM|nr:5019_t:CDS:2 [Acaulospora morrowiae]